MRCALRGSSPVKRTVILGIPETIPRSDASTVVSSAAARAAEGSTEDGSTPVRRAPIVTVILYEGMLQRRSRRAGTAVFRGRLDRLDCAEANFPRFHYGPGSSFTTR